MKGKGTMTNEGLVSALKRNKDFLSHLADDLPKREFIPLKVKAHPRQADIDALKNYPSKHAYH